jgi:uncharacterized membrane protein YesL
VSGITQPLELGVEYEEIYGDKMEYYRINLNFISFLIILTMLYCNLNYTTYSQKNYAELTLPTMM